MKRKHRYNLTTTWTGDNGSGTSSYHAYDRSYTISIPGKPDISGSSDPAFHGDGSKYNPEEMFLASVSSCHALWYLHLCAAAGITVVSYADAATGVMQEREDGSGCFTEITLHPHVVITDKSAIKTATELHGQANQFCFIANSCNFPIHHQPVITTDPEGG